MECEILNALFEEGDCSFLKAKPVIFAQLFEHIHQTPEVVVIAADTTFGVRSFHRASGSSAKDSNKYLSTGLNVSIQEFDDYSFRSLNQSEELIFCYREVGALIIFNIFFNQPIIFSI